MLLRLEISITYLLRVHNYAYLTGRQFQSESKRYDIMGDAGFFWPYTEADVQSSTKKTTTKNASTTSTDTTTDTTTENSISTETEITTETSTEGNAETESEKTASEKTASEKTASEKVQIENVAVLTPELKKDRETHRRVIDGPVDKRLRACASTQVKRREESLTRLQSEMNTAINTSIDALVARNTERESEKRYRCTLSGKLFLEPKFIHKHIMSKHGHLAERAKKEAIFKFMYHQYMSDPKKRVSPRMVEAKERQRQERERDRRGNHGTFKIEKLKCNCVTILDCNYRKKL